MTNEQFPNLLTKFLAEIKKKFGITAKLLTNELNLSKNTITNWKKGVSKPNKKLLEKLLGYLETLKKEKCPFLDGNDSFCNLVEELILLLNSELSIMFEREILRYDKEEQKAIEKECRTIFPKNFSNFIDFLSKVAELYESEYESETSSYLKLSGYQKKELFDNLLALKLISKNSRGTISIQKNLANCLGVSEAQVSRWKKGEDYPSLQNLKKIADLCNLSSDAPFSGYEYGIDKFESMFLISIDLSLELEKFEYEYFEKIKLVIKESGYNGILESKIKEDDYLIFYENEDLDTARDIIYRDCIMLLQKSFKYLKEPYSFEEWLFKKIQSKKMDILMYRTREYYLETVGDCFRFADAIDYGYKVLRNYLYYNESFDSVQEYILERQTLFVLSRVFIDSFKDKEKNFGEWLEGTKELFNQKDFFREPCHNICTSLNKRKIDNSLDYVEAFYEQFWSLILYKLISVHIDTRPADKVYLEIGIEGMWNNLRKDYLLLKSILSSIYEKERMKAEGKINLCSNMKYLIDGADVFETILFDDSLIEFNKKYDGSGYDFEITKEKRRLYGKVIDFRNKRAN